MVLSTQVSIKSHGKPSLGSGVWRMDLLSEQESAIREGFWASEAQLVLNFNNVFSSPLYESGRNFGSSVHSIFPCL